MDSNSVDELLNVLKDQFGSICRIIKLEKERENLLLKGKATNFDSLNHQIGLEGKLLEKLEGKRANTTGDISSWNDLRQSYSNEDFSKLESSRKKVFGSMENLKKLLKSNRQMLESHFSIISGTISQITGEPIGGNNTYGPGLSRKISALPLAVSQIV